MQKTWLPPDTKVPTDWLLPDGTLRLMTAASIDAWSHDSRRLFCHLNARYGLPTVELIDWLRDRIAGRRAIEIGAGAGDLCWHLGIRGTDSKLQNRPDIAHYYNAMRQPRIPYPDWIEEIDAVDAVHLYNPEVVIGCWVTHWIDPDLPIPEGGGNAYGVREDAILATGAEYIMIGNLAVHAHKPVLRQPHEEVTLPGLRSRAVHPELDRVFIWPAPSAPTRQHGIGAAI